MHPNTEGINKDYMNSFFSTKFNQGCVEQCSQLEHKYILTHLLALKSFS